MSAAAAGTRAHDDGNAGDGGDDDAGDEKGAESAADRGEGAKERAALAALDLQHVDGCTCVLCGCVSHLRALCPRPTKLEDFEAVQRERMRAMQAARAEEDRGEGEGVEGGDDNGGGGEA